MNITYKQDTLSNIDSCGYGSSISAPVAVVLLPPEPQQSALDFVINTPSEQEIYRSYLSWRILLQVCDMQIEEYNLAINGDRELWKTRILSTLQWISETAQTFKPCQFPNDIKPATAASAALSVSGVNWCAAMIHSLNVMFLNVPNVDTSKIEITSIQPPASSDWMLSDNLPALLEADNTYQL